MEHKMQLLEESILMKFKSHIVQMELLSAIFNAFSLLLFKSHIVQMEQGLRGSITVLYTNLNPT